MIKNKKKALVTGAGGFIGHHLVKYLKKKGYWVRGVDIKKPLYEKTEADEFLVLDLREYKNCLISSKGMDEVYGLAADMGGMGYIAFNNSKIIHNNTLIDQHGIEAARNNKVKRYFYSSSACIYPEYKQEKVNIKPLKEEDAFPALPQDAYGWEKLLSEITLKHYGIDHKIKVRIARFHNIYGPLGTWDGERAKAPASLARKIAQAKLSGKNTIEIWGDGKQTRSFCYIDDCVEGIYKLMHSKHEEPINIGSDELTTIDNFAHLIAKIAGIKIKIKHIKGPQGVRGRNSDNNKIKKVLGWSPEMKLAQGMIKTYNWVESQVQKTLKKQATHEK